MLVKHYYVLLVGCILGGQMLSAQVKDVPIIYTGALDKCSGAESVRLFQRAAEGDQAAAAELKALEEECTVDMMDQVKSEIRLKAEEKQTDNDFSSNTPKNTIAPVYEKKTAKEESRLLNELSRHVIANKTNDLGGFAVWHEREGERGSSHVKDLFKLDSSIEQIEDLEYNYYLNLYKQNEFDTVTLENISDMNDNYYNQWQKNGKANLNQYVLVIIIPSKDDVYKVVFKNGKKYHEKPIRGWDPKWFRSKEKGGIADSLRDKMVKVASLSKEVKLVQYFEKTEKTAMLVTVNNKEELFAISSYSIKATIQNDLLKEGYLTDLRKGIISKDLKDKYFKKKGRE